jgi:hypothetical protein
MFVELGKVLTHLRCLNCHPSGDRPRQGDTARLHQPPVERGPDGYGLPAMRCTICHQAANFELGHVPGNPIWHLAPREMGWEGKTLGQICAQIKDPARNGNRTPEALIEHMRGDHLVGWAWAPGSGRKPAPGTQKQAGALAESSEKTGAACLARLALEQVVGSPTLPMEPLKKRLVASDLPQWATILRPARALKRGSRTAAGTISRGKDYIARLEWRGSMFIQHSTHFPF